MRLEDVISTKEAARILGCDRANVARLCRAGRVRAKDISQSGGDTFTRWAIDRRDVLRLKRERKGT